MRQHRQLLIKRFALAFTWASLLPGVVLAQSGAPPGAVEKPVATAPPLPGKDGAPPPVKPSVSRVIKDAVLPGVDGRPPPPKPNVTRTTGDEDEMDDLDVQRRTAPSDLGDKPLPNPAEVLLKKAAAAAPTLIKKATVGGGSVARTTGDEDEMDDLDVQRRTAPSDLGDKPLPALNSPLPKGKAVAAPSLPVNPAAIAMSVTSKSVPNSGGAALSVSSASLKTSRSVYATDQVITVTYSGMPGSRDWLTIVPVGTPENKYGEWAWLSGPSGTYKGNRVYEPGTYEVRAFENWPAGSYNVKAMTTFEVR